MISFSLKNLPIKSWSLPFNLQRRDKLILTVVGLGLGLFIIAQLIIFPILDRRTRLRGQIMTQTRALAEMNQLKSEYEKLTQHAHQSGLKLKARVSGFTLFSFLDTLAGKSGIKQNIAYMKPSTTTLKNSPYTLSMVELKINTLTMEQLVNFLHGVETSPNLIWIKRISISKDEKEGDLINAVVQVETYQP
jgi:general secretion pathway protein M